MLDAHRPNLYSTWLRDKNVKPQLRGEYYLSVWPELKGKWDKVGALDAAFDKDNPLGQWRYIVQELYGIKLDL
jgi:hypothetical protein